MSGRLILFRRRFALHRRLHPRQEALLGLLPLGAVGGSSHVAGFLEVDGVPLTGAPFGTLLPRPLTDLSAINKKRPTA